jgi:hypothetical protein
MRWDYGDEVSVAVTDESGSHGIRQKKNNVSHG